MASRVERSRSPQLSLTDGRRGEAAGASGTPPLKLDLSRMELRLGSEVAKVYYFADAPEMPWFQAKPIVVHLGYTQVTYALDHVHTDDKMALKELFDAKGQPFGVRGESPPTLGYHDGKSSYINESGMYALIFGSKKKEAAEFKRWVTCEVLPSIRRKGFYGDVQSSRDSVVLLTSAVGNLSAALQARDAALLPALQAHGAEQLAAARASFLEALAALAAKVTTLPFCLGQKISDVISAAVMSPGSALVKNLRAATKKTAVRSTHSARRFPAAQKATQLEVLACLVSLLSVQTV